MPAEGATTILEAPVTEPRPHSAQHGVEVAGASRTFRTRRGEVTALAGVAARPRPAALDALTRSQAQGWLAGALAHEPRTVVLVTHDVEEAVLLGDRVIVMSPRPGRAVAELAVPLPRPRQRTHPEVQDLRERALAA